MPVPASLQDRAAELRKQINHHNHLYHVLDQPEISDYDYDLLFRELNELEERHPELVAPDSPTQRVGAPAVESFGAVEHRLPLAQPGQRLQPRRAQGLERRGPSAWSRGQTSSTSAS